MTDTCAPGAESDEQPAAMKKRSTMVCASCAVAGDLGWCGRCRSIAYCCKECMDSDAARHLPECKQRRSEMLAKLARAKEHKRRMIEAAGCRAEDASKAVGTLCLSCQETMEIGGDAGTESEISAGVMATRRTRRSGRKICFSSSRCG